LPSGQLEKKGRCSLLCIKGFGGCPMAEDELVGNLATENLIQYLLEKNVETQINEMRFNEALSASSDVFLAYH
jgi:hydroxymethylglutaryl-CoA lyase